MRTPQVIVTYHYSIKGQPDIAGAPVWGWSFSDGASPGRPCVVNDAVPGDYIVWNEPFTDNGRQMRQRPWSVVRTRRLRSGKACTPIGCGAVSRPRTVEAAVMSAAAMLRRDERDRAAAARGACERNEPTDCPDAHTCRHGING